MRSLSEIVEANRRAEAKERSNDAEDLRERREAGIARAHEQGGPTMDYAINRCKACDEAVEDCLCDRELDGGKVQ